MWQYIFRRVLYAIPVLIGVNIITFALFFMLNSPDNIAHMQLGSKHVTKAEIDNWKKTHGYDLPLFYNSEQHSFTQTIFWQKSIRLFVFDFGVSDGGRDISEAISDRYLPSLSIAVPALIVGLFVNIVTAMVMAFFRGGYIDHWGVILCVITMSISTLFYIIAGQYFVARVLKWVPVSGYVDGFYSLKFIALPVLVSVVAGIGAGARWYRALFLEEISKDYVRTARAKGLSEPQVLFGHVLSNALVPILTGVVVIIPLLFMGSLLLESFFAIPGLGSFTIDAIQNQDFSIVRAMVFLGTILYIVGLILTDISYVIVDPRVRFN